MSEVQILREKAAQAERLAWTVTDRETTERLLELAREYKRQAEALLWRRKYH